MANTTHARLGLSIQQPEKQAPEERVQNWEEVYQGFDLTRARVEAARCIHCPSTPCISACPVHNDIPTALLKLEHGDVLGAAAVFRETSTLPEMCGRLCPQERLCEGDCPVGFAIRSDGRHEPPVSIGKLEAFVADAQRERIGGFPLPEPPKPSGHKVAVVGSGPSGLTVAEALVTRGHAVTIFEQWGQPGGALAHGIPNFKLGRSILQDKIRSLTLQGVDFICDVRIGRDVTVDMLFAEGFGAIYLGIGAGVDQPLNIPGERDLTGVVAATDFLVRANASSSRLLPSPNGPRATGTSVAPRNGPRVVVVGGSDAAMDCVRAALRLGASEVTLVAGSEMEGLASRAEEMNHAREEGVRFRLGIVAVAFDGDARGRLTGVRCERVSRSGSNGTQHKAIRMRGSDFLIECDLAVVARGYAPDPFLRDTTPGLKTDDKNHVIADPDTGRTSRPGVFAGGDGVHGASLVVNAIAAGKHAAAAIDAYLSQLAPGTPPVAALPAGPRPKQEKKRGWFRRK
ncbi:MAG: FAD-dependent oxidoreductase [Dehalococcoidia bacterium]